MTLNIAIDARPLIQPITGIGRYLHNTLDKLIPLTPDIHWHLFSTHPIEFTINKDNVSLSIISPFHSHKKKPKIINSLFSFFVSQTLFAFLCYKKNIDIYWSPRHHLPILLPARTKKIVTIHDLVWIQCPKSMPLLRLVLEKLITPLSIRQSDAIFCISQSTKNDLINFNKSIEPKVHLIECNPVHSTNPLKPTRLFDNPYLLFVGTLEPRKNLRRLLVAYSELINNGITNDRLVIVGANGWGKQKIDSLIFSLGISSMVTVTGYISDEALNDLYINTKLTILPSLYEGFGLTALESIMQGSPVITSNLSSLPEVVGTKAAIINPYKISSIESALTKFYTDDKFRNELLTSLKERAIHFRSLDGSKQIKAVINQLL